MLNAAKGVLPRTLGSRVSLDRSTRNLRARRTGRLAAVALDVGRHRPVRHAREAGPVERRQNRARVAVPEIGLGTRPIGEARNDALSDTARAVATASDPDRIDTVVVRDLDESARPGGIVACEMSR